MLLFILHNLFASPHKQKERAGKKMHALADQITSADTAEHLADYLSQKERMQEADEAALQSRVRTIMIIATLFLIAAAGLALLFLATRIYEGKTGLFVYAAGLYLLFDSLVFFMLRNNVARRTITDAELLKIAADAKLKAFLKNSIIAQMVSLESNGEAVQSFRRSLNNGMITLSASLLLVFFGAGVSIQQSKPVSALTDKPIRVELGDNPSFDNMEEKLDQISGTLRTMNYNLHKLREEQNTRKEE